MKIHVPAGGNLQAAIDAAQPSDIVELEAAAAFVGNFTVSKPLTLTTSGPLPAVKLATADVGALPVLRTTNAQPAFRTIGPAQDVTCCGVHFAANDSSGDVVALGDTQCADAAGLPDRLLFDRCAVSATTRAKRGISLNSRGTDIRGCHLTGIRYSGQETQTICGWNGPGPFVIEDCYLEAGSIGFMLGGAAAAIRDLVPGPLTFQRNTITRPLSMFGTVAGIKNLFELKNARDVVVRGCLFENNWVDGQSGFAIVFTVRANSPNAPWSTVQRVLFESNIVRHTASAFNVLGLDNQTSGGAVYPSTRMDDVRIVNNLIYDIDRDAWKSPGGSLGAGVFVQIGAAPRNLHIYQNTAMGAGSITGNITALSGDPIPGFVFARNITQKIVTPYQTYGVFGDGVGEGNPALARYAPNCDGYAATDFTGNVLAGCTAKTYDQHPGQFFPSCADLADQFIDPASGNFRLVPGSPFTGCGCDFDALEAAFCPPDTPEPPSDIADVIRRLADDMLSAVPTIGGDVSPQAAATHAIEDYRDAMLDSLE